MQVLQKFAWIKIPRDCLLRAHTINLTCPYDFIKIHHILYKQPRDFLKDGTFYCTGLSLLALRIDTSEPSADYKTKTIIYIYIYIYTCSMIKLVGS